MEPSVLVASHLSAPPTQVHPAYSNQKVFTEPIPPYASSESPEHASFSSLFHTPRTGPILVRVSHAGRQLELISLAHDVPPLRFDFSAAILPHPSIMLWENTEIHVLLVTRARSLYRIIVPLRETTPLWAFTTNGEWYREYAIQSPCDGLVQVLSTHCVVLTLRDGSLLRLEADAFGADTREGKRIAFRRLRLSASPPPLCL